MGPDGPKWGQEDFFLANPDLADILGRTDFDFENFYFLDFLGPHLGPDLGPAWAQLGPSLGPGLGPGLGPDAAAGAGAGAGGAAGRILRSQPDPSSNPPRDQTRRKEPLLRLDVLCWLKSRSNGVRELTDALRSFEIISN